MEESESIYSNNPTPTPIVEPVLQPEETPTLPIRPNKSTNPILPIIFGVIVVFVIASVFAGVYYFSKLKREVATTAPEPSPSPTIVVAASPEVEPSASPNSSPTNTKIPVASPTPTPITSTKYSLDIRFGNPSAVVKQTIDEGDGDGRVINREYNSLQVGEFDEVRSTFSPRATTCFQIVSNETIEGEKVGFTITQDDKVISEGTLKQYEKLESGRLYALCQDVSTDLGNHTIRLSINNTRSLGESNYGNNNARIDYKNLADNIAPNFTLAGPYNWDNKGTCLVINAVDDNVTSNSDLTIEEKIDGADWTKTDHSTYCFTGNSGDAHTYSYRITDKRGNQNTQSKSFNLF